MATLDSRVDTYIAQSADFAKPLLKHLREVVHAACPDVEETIKWGAPHFMHKGMLCNMAAFKGHCAFGFWKGAMIFQQGESKGDEAMGHYGRITCLSDLPSRKSMLSHVKEAVRLNEEGIRAPAPTKTGKKKRLVVPTDLNEALKKNKKALATFENFSYSHRKEYVEWLTEAKTQATRDRRLATAIEWMAEGKTHHWKYAKR